MPVGFFLIFQDVIVPEKTRFKCARGTKGFEGETGSRRRKGSIVVFLYQLQSSCTYRPSATRPSIQAAAFCCASAAPPYP